MWRALLATLGVALGVAAEASSFGEIGIGRAVADATVGWAFIGGALALGRGRAALLLGAVGVLWFAGTWWADIAYLHRGPLVQLALAWLPPRRRAWPALVALAYLAALADRPPLTAAVALLVAISAIGAARLPACTAGLTAAAWAIGALAPSYDASSTAGDALLLAYEAALVGVAASVLVTAARARRRPALVADLVVELGRAGAAPRDALARALGDPELQVAYPVDDGYVDADGVAATLAPGSAIIETPGAVVAYDPATITDPRLADVAASAARLAFANAALQADVAAQLHELRASRRRLVEAADGERASLEARLHDGVERDLDDLAVLLTRLAPDVAQVAAAARELSLARADLRALAGGLHPRVLREHGLAAALHALVAHAPWQVTVSAPDARYPPGIEATAYFVCAEALANAGKHSRASAIRCTVGVGDGALAVTVSDDGIGGADATGSGLRGLADRVEAVGGELKVISHMGGGTTVRARIPI